MFSINCLEITASKSQWEENKSLYKNLLSDKDYNGLGENTPVNKRYLFNDYYKFKADGSLEKNPNRALPENFFGKNINVQAIVGKNGSGKSSLMDLMYMAINNFSYMFERGNKEKRPGAAEMYFVPGLYAKLHFCIQKNLYELDCSDNSVYLKKKGEVQPIFATLLDELEKDIPPELKPYAEKRYEKDEKIASLVKDFFYTIVSNFSMQSFVDNNYKRQVYHHIGEYDLRTDEDRRKYEEKYKFHDYNKEPDNKEPFVKSWITPIFHKNDGYIRSIVLNPFRDEGKINLSREYELSKDRACALFIYSSLKEDISFFKPYKYKKIKAHFNPSRFITWIREIIYKYTDDTKKLFYLPELLSLKNFIQQKDSFTSKIIDIFNLNQFKTDQDLYWYSILYIEFKLIKIVNKYPIYLDYQDFFKIRYDKNTYIIQITNEKILDELLKKISQDVNVDKSHITKKIRRILSFLKIENRFSYDEEHFYHIDIEKYEKILEDEHAEISPQLIDDFLPPPIFDWELHLNKEDNNGVLILDKKTSEPLEILYNQLSSGEIQFIQTTSIHAYHLMNLISVPNDPNRPKYNHFNIVFDEVEICFHPEMQRQFLKRFIDMLTDLKADYDNFINIIIVTHSPFILSDIPTSNVLFLENGTQDVSKDKDTLTFAQNIGEMMYDSFFMDKTIGDFAESKLKRIIKIRQGRNPDNIDEKYNDDEEGKNLQEKHKKEMEMNLALIGDPVIRSLIEEIEYKEASND